MSIETEIKLRIPDERTAQRVMSDPRIVQALRLPFEDVGMDSLYYDSRSDQLLTRKWTLRLRREDGEPNVTLKTPRFSKTLGGALCRNEWQVKASSIEEAAPLLVEAGAPAEIAEIIRTGPMQERCRALFTRRRSLLYLPDQARIEMALDSGSVEAGEKSEPFSELELELIYGAPKALTLISNMLISDYSLQKEYISKYERGLRLIRSRK